MTTVMRREPIFNAPLVVVVMLAVLVGIHVVRGFLSPAWDEAVVTRFAFIPARLFHDLAGLPGGALVRYGQLVTHTLLHADYLHLGMNGLWLLAGGTIVARRAGAVRLIGLTLASAIAGALTFAAFNSAPSAIMVGASGGISGLLAAATRLIHAAQVDGDLSALRERIDQLHCPSLLAALVDRQVLVASALFIGLNLAIAFGFGADLTASGIAWQAHVGGYLFGLLAFGLFDRAPRPAAPEATNVPEATIH